MMANLIVFALGVSNIILLLIVFTLMARPQYLLPMLRRWMRATELTDERLLSVVLQLRWLWLVLLFCWSFCCSALIVYAKIFLS
ncbi:MAG: hypothetical protein VXZ96_03525 [Myxococcota bacterium]|nr:hypothetical protein [Myxococcota bacterium]